MQEETGRYHILLTAVTHAAIQACLSKLNALMEIYRRFPGMKLGWLNKVRLERVHSGALHPSPKDDDATYIFAGTVYQVRMTKFC